jgi:hypothetical protein
MPCNRDYHVHAGITVACLVLLLPASAAAMLPVAHGEMLEGVGVLWAELVWGSFCVVVGGGRS